MIKNGLKGLFYDLSRIKIFDKLKMYSGSEDLLSRHLHEVYMNVIRFWFQAYRECKRGGMSKSRFNLSLSLSSSCSYKSYEEGIHDIPHQETSGNNR
jgi:phosphate uptake regulator